MKRRVWLLFRKRKSTAKTAAESAGKAEVVVTDEVGSSSGCTSFTYATPPTVTKVEPSEGTTLGGASVTIKGTGFVKTPTVTIGKAATSVVWVSETELTAKTAAGVAGKARSGCYEPERGRLRRLVRNTRM